MEKVTKIYAEVLTYGREWDSYEVESMDPQYVDYESVRAPIIRFYEQSFILDEGETYSGPKKVTPNIYIGKRISAEEALSMCDPESMMGIGLQNCIRNNRKVSVCQTDLGALITMEDDAVTLEEYAKSKKL